MFTGTGMVFTSFNFLIITVEGNLLSIFGVYWLAAHIFWETLRWSCIFCSYHWQTTGHTNILIAFRLFRTIMPAINCSFLIVCPRDGFFALTIFHTEFSIIAITGIFSCSHLLEESAGSLIIICWIAIFLEHAISPWLRINAPCTILGFESMIFDPRWAIAMLNWILCFNADISCHT